MSCLIIHTGDCYTAACRIRTYAYFYNGLPPPPITLSFPWEDVSNRMKIRDVEYGHFEFSYAYILLQQDRHLDGTDKRQRLQEYNFQSFTMMNT